MMADQVRKAPLRIATRVYGKVIICGEHSVVYGGGAVGMPLKDSFLDLQIRPSDRAYHELKINGDVISSSVSSLIDDAFRELQVDPFPVTIFGQSSLSPGAGLGASAALSVGVLRLVRAIAKKPKKLSERDIPILANRLERRFHGQPSGLDTTIVSQDRVIFFAKGRTPLWIKCIPAKVGRKSLPWCFALIDTGSRASTKIMVQRASPFFRGAAGRARIKEFNQCCRRVCEGFALGEMRLVAQGMKRSGELLEDVGVVTEAQKEVIESSYSCGVLASKITGSGGGGYVLALLDPACVDESIARLVDCYGEKNIKKFTY